MMSRVIGLVVLAVLLVLLVIDLAGVVRGWDQLRPVSSGQGAPQLVLPRAEGGRFDLSQQRGKVVLLSFWASWCSPCLKELPLLAKLQQELGPRGLSVVGVNIEGSAARVAQVRSHIGAAKSLTMALDQGGAAAQRYGVQTLPHLVLVDRQGQVVYIHVGARGADQLVQRVRQLVAAPGGGPSSRPANRNGDPQGAQARPRAR